MYTSPRFRKTRDYAVLLGNPWYILSGKYGLLRPDELIQPYDLSLKHVNNIEKERWARDIVCSIKKISLIGDCITILAGEAYRKYLVPALRAAGYTVNVPLQGVSLGRQVQWLNRYINPNLSDLNRFYDILSDLERGLGGKRKLEQCTGKLPWPQRGVYFFFEEGEDRKAWPIKPRVVRVGTHAVSKGSTSTLWGRLRAHKGLSDGGGNHRSSIFRLHVGEAIIKKNNSKRAFPSWGKGMFAEAEVIESERDLEIQVSKLITKMPLLWVNVDDLPSKSSDRAYIEKNAIALISNFENPSDSPSKNWLGNFSTRSTIQRSGLWNIQHTKEKHDPRFLYALEYYVDLTLGRIPKLNESITPFWRRPVNEVKGSQTRLDLFGDKQ